MNQRYHIHVCYAAGDVCSERSLMMQKMADICFFTWSYHDIPTFDSQYSRNQIKQCDLVIFLVGSRYGQIAPNGVAYLYSDFMYANTLLKPKLALILANPDRVINESISSKDTNQLLNSQRNLEDFRKILSNTCPDSTFTYHSVDDFPQILLKNFEELKTKNDDLASKFWIRSSTKDLQNQTTATNNKTTEDVSGEFTVVGVEKTQLHDKIDFIYKVHAFKGGNFKELKLQTTFPWGQILNIVADNVRMPENEDIIAKSLHAYLDSNALEHVKKIIPDAHAAIRSQLDSKDLQSIKLQFVANDWITITSVNNNSKKQVILTPNGARQVTQWRSVIERNKLES